MRSGLGTSLQVGLLTTVVSVFAALTGVLWWRHASPRGRRVFDVSVYVRLVLPAVVSATALFLIFTRVGVQLGMATTVIGQSVWDSAFATVILQARVRLLDPAVEEAAADLGAKTGERLLPGHPAGPAARHPGGRRPCLQPVVRRRRDRLLPGRLAASRRCRCSSSA